MPPELIWALASLVVAAVMLAASAYFMVIALRMEAKERRDAKEGTEPSAEIVIPLRMRRMRDRFIVQHVRTSRFGGGRHGCGPLTEILRPETGPIDLPDEHVEPELEKVAVG